jgi:hypothetical protein
VRIAQVFRLVLVFSIWWKCRCKKEREALYFTKFNNQKLKRSYTFTLSNLNLLNLSHITHLNATHHLLHSSPFLLLLLLSLLLIHPPMYSVSMRLTSKEYRTSPLLDVAYAKLQLQLQLLALLTSFSSVSCLAFLQMDRQTANMETTQGSRSLPLHLPNKDPFCVQAKGCE